MNYLTFLVFFILATATAVAQPVITRANLMHAGDTYATSDVASVVSEGNSGPGVVWDFSGVDGSPAVAYDVVLAGMTPYGGNYPAANLAFVAQGNSLYQYQDLNDNALEELGYVVPGFSALTFNDSRQYLQLPLAFGNQWNDGYTYTIAYQTNPPITTLGEGTFTAEVDGYGTVILPQATFTDALRVAVIGTSTDTTDLGFNLYERNYYHDTTFIWLSPSYHAPVCTRVSSSLVRYTTVAIGDTMVIEETDAFMSFSFDPGAEPSPSATLDAGVGRMQIHVSPNPISENIELSLHSDDFQDMRFELHDVNGVLVFSETIQAVSGANTISLKLPAHAPGIYIATLQSPSGIGVRKLLSTGLTR